MNKMRNLISALLGLAVLAALAGCSGPEPVHSDSPVQTPTPQPAETDTPTPTPQPPTATPRPTETPVMATPTQTPYITSTPIPASQMQGEWRRITTADGLCTDWPVFIGHWYIGTSTTTICSLPRSIDEAAWDTMSIPQGTRVTAAVKFPPGGGLGIATDEGVCRDISWLTEERPSGPVWECLAAEEGVPTGIRRMVSLAGKPVYMLADSVMYENQTYNIPEMVDNEDAHPTWIAVSGEFRPRPSSRVEIWIGTDGYGIIVVHPDTGAIERHTTSDGLPGNSIRDINTAGENYHYGYQYVWVATDNGLGYWDGESWITYTTEDGLPSNDVRGVASGGGRRNIIWVATGGGVAYFDGQSWRAFTHEEGLPEGDLNGVKFSGDKIWFSTRGSGLLVFVIQTPTQ